MKKSIIIPVFSILSIVGLLFCGIMIYFNFAIEPVDKTDTELQTITLESSRLSSISKDLEEAGLIKNSLAFQLRAQLSGTAGKVSRGTYYLSRDMDADKIISILGKGNHDTSTIVSVRIPEGSSISEITNILYEENVIYDKENFLQECKEGLSFKDNEAYSYLNVENFEGEYLLEGYLFPDTYDFYYNTKPVDAIAKMLNRFNELYTPELQEKAKQMGYTTKNIITLASIIQKEGNEGDFSKVSAVLHNRLENNMSLQCDSTIRYVSNTSNTMSLSNKQFNMDSPYNTYKNKGMIPSPIGNPSLKAINAVLNPDQSFINEKYMYFCSTDSSNSDLVFAKTYQEHLDNVKQYKSYWEEYDKTIRNN